MTLVTNLLDIPAFYIPPQLNILIDEYDKPILDALYTEYEEANRQELCKRSKLAGGKNKL